MGGRVTRDVRHREVSKRCRGVKRFVRMDVITRYSVTDLVLHSPEDLTALAAAFEAQRLTVTQRALEIDETARGYFRIAATDRMWVFQLGCEEHCDELEPDIAAFLTAVETLDPPERAAWAGCSRREFDIAYDCGTKPFSVRHELSAGTLARLVAAGVSLRMTLYSLDPSEIQAAEPGAAADGGGM